MTSIWEQHDVYRHVIRILEDALPGGGVGEHLGRPFLTAYQIAIKLDEQVPELRGALGVEVGGSGVGDHFTLSSYVGKQLSRIARDEPEGRLEGGLLGNQSVAVLQFKDAQGRTVDSSLESSQTPSLFRLRG